MRLVGPHARMTRRHLCRNVVLRGRQITGTVGDAVTLLQWGGARGCQERDNMA